MIIFDLDGTLADCEHRRHFVDPRKRECKCGNQLNHICYKCKHWEPNWPAFYEACDQDEPIEPTISLLNHIFRKQIQESRDHFSSIQIWSGRCESAREKTLIWFYKNGIPTNLPLKMRSIGDNTPDGLLKERWLEEAVAEGRSVGFVFFSGHVR